MGIGRNLDPKHARAYSISVYRTRGVATGKDAIIACQLPRSRNFKLADAPRHDSSAGQRTLVCNSLNDEEWSDDLFNPLSGQKPVRRSQLCESTNLNRKEDGFEEIRNGASGGP